MASKSRKKGKAKIAFFIIILIIIIALAYAYTMGYLDPVIDMVNSHIDNSKNPNGQLSGDKDDNSDEGKDNDDTGNEIDESYDLNDYLDATPPITALNTGDLAIHFVNVGQGDCIIIQLPDGANMIIDAGSVYNSNTIKSLIMDYIDNLQITVFDYMVLTHTDGDHIYYMDDIILNYEIHNFYSPSTTTSQTETKAYQAYIDARDNETGANYYINKKGLQITGQGYSIDFYSPAQDYYSDVNNYSPIMVLDYAGRKIMFVGDAEKEAEEEFLSNYPDGIDVDVLKVGHHGSETSSTQEFLDAVKPEYAVICVNVQQALGKKWIHPNHDVLARLANMECEVYRTDLRGNVVLYITSLGQMQFVCTMEESESGLIKPVETSTVINVSSMTKWYIINNFYIPKNKYFYSIG